MTDYMAFAYLEGATDPDEGLHDVSALIIPSLVDILAKPPHDKLPTLYEAAQGLIGDARAEQLRRFSSSALCN